MSLQWFLQREVPADTATIGQVILKPNNPFRQIGDRFNDLFPEESIFAPLYFDTGRGARPPLLMALVTVFQMLEKVPDRLAADYVVSRLDWKYALHLPLTYTGFHFTDRFAFRQRLLEHEQERLPFEAFSFQLKKLGFLKARGQMRTDSTHMLGVVQRLSQLELITESLRVALHAVTALAAEWVTQTLPPAFPEAYAQPQSEYGLSEAKVQQRLVQVGRDGFWFLNQLEHSAPEGVRHLPEVEVLRTVLQQQFPNGPGNPPTLKRKMGHDMIESPHEPEARFGKKRGKDWIGYKVQVTETCDEDAPHVIGDVAVTGALDNDAPELPHIQARLQERELLPSEQQVDQGYMSGQNLVDSAESGIQLMGVPLNDTQGPAGFRQGDFQIDEVHHQATCPAQQASVVWAERASPAGRPPAIQIRFDGKTCRTCPGFGRCTVSPQGRSLTRHPYRTELNARRAEAQTEAFRERLHLRAGIEGTLSELVRAHRLRFARYRGKVKIGLQGLFTAVAANLKRVVRWWTRPEPAQVAAQAVA
jgi:transposase